MLEHNLIKIVHIFLNLLTIINTSCLPIIYLLKRHNYCKLIQDKPFKNSAILFLLCICFMALGGFLAGVQPWSSYFLTNGTFLYLNYLMYKK